MFNTAAECIIDSLMEKDTADGNEKTCNLERNIFFLKLSPTLERASISSQIAERPAIHGRDAGGIRRRISVSYFQMVTVMGWIAND